MEDPEKVPKLAKKICHRFLKPTSSDKRSRLRQANPKKKVEPIAPTRQIRPTSDSKLLGTSRASAVSCQSNRKSDYPRSGMYMEISEEYGHTVLGSYRTEKVLLLGLIVAESPQA